MSRPSKASRSGREAGRAQARPRCGSEGRHTRQIGTPLCGEARYEHVGLASPKPGCRLRQTTATGRNHKGRRSRAKRRTTRHSRLPYHFRGHLHSSDRTGSTAVSRPLRTVRRRGRSRQTPGAVRQRLALHANHLDGLSRADSVGLRISLAAVPVVAVVAWRLPSVPISLGRRAGDHESVS